MDTCKPFGWEMMDIRYGGLLARLRALRDKVECFADGRCEAIPEFDEEPKEVPGRLAGNLPVLSWELAVTSSIVSVY